MKNKRILILGSYGQGNLGDDAILVSTLSTFRDIIPDAELTVFCRDTEWMRDGVEAETINAWRFRDIFNVIDAHRRTDLFILGGGGLIQDKTSILNLVFWYSHVLISKLFRKPVMCYALGVGPVDSMAGRILTRIMLNRVDLITLRDNTSKQALDRMKVNKPVIHVTADPALLLPEGNPDKAVESLAKEGVIKDGKPLIAVCIFYWFHTKRFLPVKFVLEKNLWTGVEREKFREFKKSIASLSDHLINKLNAHVVFIPMKKTDYRAAAEIIELMGSKDNITLILEGFSSVETKSLLGKMDLSIGMHLHSLILSASMNVPVFGLAYDPKIIGFMSLMGKEECMYDINKKINVDELYAKIEEVWLNRWDIKEQIHQRIEELKGRSLDNARLAQKLVEKNER